MKPDVQYNVESDLTKEEFVELLIASTLGERRPVDDLTRIEKMLRNANLTITARVAGRLVGVSRSLTDFVYATYLSDLAVHRDFQKQGIGKELIRRTKLETPQAMIILLSAPAAVDYYPKVGMTNFTQSYLLRNIEDLR